MTETKRMASIVHSGSLDKIYPSLMLSSAVEASNIEVNLFFTFWGLNVIRKNGLKKVQLRNFMRLFSGLQREMMEKIGLASLIELLQTTVESGKMRLYACIVSMSLINIINETLILEVSDFIGATSFLDIASECDAQLFI